MLIPVGVGSHTLQCTRYHMPTSQSVLSAGIFVSSLYSYPLKYPSLEHLWKVSWTSKKYGAKTPCPSVECQKLNILKQNSVT